MVIKQTKKLKMKLSNDEENATHEMEPVPKEILVIAQEIKIVQSLVSNDVNKRNRQMRLLRKWLKIRSQSSFPFTEADFMRIWKGLYYNMWMSDKPLVQEELAEGIAKLLECFDDDHLVAVNFFGAFLKTMTIEWFGIDQWRIDKFMMLARRMLRYTFLVLRSSGWSGELIKHLNVHLEGTILSKEVIATGLIMHILDIYFEELAKVSDGNIIAEIVGQFVEPFITYLGKQKDSKLVWHCQKRVFHHLLYQSSLGRDYFERYNAWKNMGFPATIDDLEKNEEIESELQNDDDNDVDVNADAEKHLDPRAGKVDVFMPELPLDATTIIDGLKTILNEYELSTKRRKMLKKLQGVFEIYATGHFPLGVKRMPRFEAKSEKPLLMEKVQSLQKMENEVFSTNRKLKQLNKRKRHKLLNSLNLENANVDNFEQIIEAALPKQINNERKRKAKYAFMNSWFEEELTEEDIAPKKLAKISNANDNNNENDDRIVKKKQKQQRQKNKKELGLQKKKNKNKKLKTTAAATTLIQNEQKCLSETSITTTTTTAAATTAKTTNDSAWQEPLATGEYEYFVPSRKTQIKAANKKLVLNPLSIKSKADVKNNTNANTDINSSSSSSTSNLPQIFSSFAASAKSLLQRTASNTSLPSSEKRVKIMLKNNTTQNTHEYFKQICSSPNIPYDAQRQPTKSLLKPNSMPSPINPFYKKQIGLKFMNETM